MLYAFSGESKLVVATGLDCVDTRLALAWLGISDALGFDVEWSVGLGVAQRPALLQLCSGQRCLLMRLHTTSVLPECLVGILTDVDIVKTGVGIGGDFTRLVNSFRFAADKDCGLVDVARLASVAGHRGEGSLRALVKTYLGYELDKRVPHELGELCTLFSTSKLCCYRCRCWSPAFQEVVISRTDGQTRILPRCDMFVKYLLSAGVSAR